MPNGERLCLKVVYDAPTGKFFAPIIDHESDCSTAENSFLLRSMVFHGSHINHLMLTRSIRVVLPRQDSENLTENEKELINTCFSPLLILLTKKSAQRMIQAEQIISRWSHFHNPDSTKLLKVSMVAEDAEFESQKPVVGYELALDSPQR